MLTPSTTILTALVSVSLFISGYFSAKHKSLNELADPCIFFGTLVGGVTLAAFFGVITALFVIVPTSIATFAYLARLPSLSVLEKAFYEVSKEFVFLGIMITCLYFFSEQVRGIFNFIASNPVNFILFNAAFGIFNIWIHHRFAKEKWAKTFYQAFYIQLAISTILIFDVEMLFVLLTATLGLIKYTPIIQKRLPTSILVEFANQYFIPLLVIALIRFFLIQPYQVPTGSLEPTIMPGDFLLVNQYQYGLRLPLNQYQIVPISTPKRGDIVVFQSPVGEEKLVKRVVGLPGDHVIYKNKQLILNGIPVSQAPSKEKGAKTSRHAVQLTEYLPGKTHEILIDPHFNNEVIDIIIPEGHYFMMGDNRDNSGDSRIFGPVADEMLIGKAFIIWMNWNPESGQIDRDRIGTSL